MSGNAKRWPSDEVLAEVGARGSRVSLNEDTARAAVRELISARREISRLRSAAIVVRVAYRDNKNLAHPMCALDEAIWPDAADSEAYFYALDAKENDNG